MQKTHYHNKTYLCISLKSVLWVFGEMTKERHTREAFINVIIQQYSHYNNNTALLVTGFNNPNILYSYFVIHYQEALPVSLAIEELQYCV